MTDIVKRPIMLSGVKLISPLFENITLYRIQLRLTTGRGRGAGSDSKVHVQLNDQEKKFYLLKGIDNFQEGHTDTYDILTSNVKKIKDIQYLRFGVTGNDGVCFKKIELFFNNASVPVFSKEYGGSAGACIDNDTPSLSKTLTIASAELRASSGWKYNSANANIWVPPNTISKAAIVSMVEAAIGNQIGYSEGIAWGSKGGIDTIWGAAVEVNFVNSKTLHFDLDLQRTLWGPNPEVDVDFDLEFSCENGIIKTEVKNVKSHTNIVGDAQAWIREKLADFLGDAIGGFLVNPAAGKAAGGLLAKFLAFSTNFNPENPNFSSSCALIKVLPTCDIQLH